MRVIKFNELNDQFKKAKLPPILNQFEVLRNPSKVLLEAKPSETVAKVSFVILLHHGKNACQYILDKLD